MLGSLNFNSPYCTLKLQLFLSFQDACKALDSSNKMKEIAAVCNFEI